MVFSCRTIELRRLEYNNPTYKVVPVTNKDEQTPFDVIHNLELIVIQRKGTSNTFAVFI